MTLAIVEYLKTQPVIRAWLFGSLARDEETPTSDVDLLVEFDHSEPIGLFRYARMHREMEELLGRKVDLVEEGTLRPAATITANQDKKIIYERAR
ncbi:MAG: nucleotidyltransferase family protein [Bacteroidaceae bacterium]|nr:nucleotidyltransferase family protein [Bacteroidaceae bacterium]